MSKNKNVRSQFQNRGGAGLRDFVTYLCRADGRGQRNARKRSNS